MTAVHLFDPHEGRHCAAARPSFFRRALRLPWRKPAVPAPHPGAGAVTPPGGRYACCSCCEEAGPCEPRDDHRAPCQDGCNDPVLGDRMIADVRREYGAGLPAAGQMRQEYFAPHVYGQAPQLAVEPGLARRVIA